jgi:hypothetical protein
MGASCECRFRAARHKTVLNHDDTANLQCARAPSSLCVYDSREANSLSFYRFDPKTGKSEELPQPRIHDSAAYIYNWTLSPDDKFLAICPKTTEQNPTITFFSLQADSQKTVVVEDWAGISSVDFGADANSVWATAFTHDGHWALLTANISQFGKAARLRTCGCWNASSQVNLPCSRLMLRVWRSECLLLKFCSPRLRSVRAVVKNSLEISTFQGSVWLRATDPDNSYASQHSRL